IPSISRIPDTVVSRRIGRELFLSNIGCSDCHGIDGRGNGPKTTDFEKNSVTDELYDEPGLHDVWGRVNQPRNLTYGIYRGGRRPVDLFRRIHAGIKGTAMTSFEAKLKHEEIWHLVNYVLSVPFETEPGRAAPTE
ncbi:MAG: cytochrome c, partial [Planctomycetaceae bacterium]